MWYKRIYKYLCFFLIVYPVFYWIFIVWTLCEDDWCPADSDFIPSMAKFFVVTYIIGIVVILGLFWVYTLFLIWNKILYHLEQFTKKIKKIFKIKKKKIWKYPIIIQYNAPKWLSASEVSYLYNLKHFKWNISCLFYKWAAEKRISMDFKKWKLLSFDQVKINIIDDSMKNMDEDEVFQWSLIFGNNKTIILPNIDILKKIPMINIQTSKWCLSKWLIEEWFSFKITYKTKKYIYFSLCILFVIYLNIHMFFWRQYPVIPLWLVIVSFFWAFIIGSGEWKASRYVWYKLSEKWKEILAEIYWYKYFLEACDEKMIKTFLKKDPLYLDKVMPYAISIWVETEIIKNISPWILDWTNTNRYVWDIASSAKTMLTASERITLLPKENWWNIVEKKKVKKLWKTKKTKKTTENKEEKNILEKPVKVKF